MNFVWKLLRFVPSPVMSAVKRHTSAALRLRMREIFGGSYRTIPDEVITLGDGRSFHVGPDTIYWPIFMGLEYEPEATSIVRKLVRPGDAVVDAGANYGWYTAILANLVGTAGCVYAFEPVPTTFSRLLEHLALNSCEERVVAACLALGAESGEVQVHVFENLSHARSSLSNLNRSKFKTHVAPSIDLDSFLESRGADRIDFLKCDVEGSELRVLRGAQRILESERAPMILVELNDETSAAFGYQPIDLWKFLKRCGYDRFYRIDSNHRLRTVASDEAIAKVNLLLSCKGDMIASRIAEDWRTKRAG